MKAFRDRDAIWLRLFWLSFGVLTFLGSKDLYLRGLGTGNGEFLGAFSKAWGIGLIAYGLLTVGIMAVDIYGIIQPSKLFGLIHTYQKRMMGYRLIRSVLAFSIALLPVAFYFSPWSWRFDLPHFRMMLLVDFAMIAGFLLPKERTHLLEKTALLLLFSSSIFVIAQQIITISDYPFATSWSEGNRLWDYSLYFGRDRYIFEEPFSYPTYLTPGRHGLWGLPFLFLTNPSIVVMRSWDVVLWTLPYLLLGVALFVRRSSLRSPWGWILALWTFLFLSQGPIYAPLILSGLILALGYNHQRLWQSLLITAIACFYAGISRWTWMVAPAVWAALWALLEEEVQQGFWKQFKRPLYLGLAGLLGAILSMVVMNIAFPRPDPIYSTSMSQPLLWYRLWSNPTNPTGVVTGLVYVVGPVLLWLIWRIVQQRARWDFLKLFALLGVLISFLAVGLVASVKIGGGSNIHNLDMFLVSLVFIVSMTFGTREAYSKFSGFGWLLCGFMLLVPVWNLTRTHKELKIPTEPDPDEVIAEMQSIIGEAAKEGEVLFIDQRQLLTFGEIKDVPLIMEYEIKDMMNQAMGHNQAYFEKFREDIKNHRFELIVSDPLYVVYQGPKIAFGEENDAWVEEVTVPVLDSYKPVVRFDEHLIWLLVPKDDSEG
jgi:hypothetical protein